jgi:putative methyltransferase|tara:strand:+ start:507 stop:2609 length:2103 start_codon:yes stop_codon:yes gene_type:complete
MKKEDSILVYLADLAHDYFTVNQYTPTGIGYLAAYSKSKLGSKVEFRLFKSINKLFEAYEKEKPDLVGFSNYTWNVALSKFAGEWIKDKDPLLPIIMGGPNIRTYRKGIEEFLVTNQYVDTYCMFAGEISVYRILKFLLDQPKSKRTSKVLKSQIFDGSYSIFKNKLIGNSNYAKPSDLDEVPSPFLTGLMDPFLKKGYYPIFETNRGCPFSCTFCIWGISALNKVLKFSMERVKSELTYVANSATESSALVLADANFGILKRDVEIAQHIRNLYDTTKSFSSIRMYWAKVAKPHMVDIGKILGHLTHTYIAFQSLDDEVLENIKRKNIRTEELSDLIEKLKGFSYGAQTDLLVGLPGETFDSHLNSYNKALSMGLTHIFGGEIQMLPGAEMDEEEHRKKYGLKTKYRFIEGGYGLYRGEFIYELQESIRETKTMTEDEMLKLRAIRAFLFASVTLGEHLPLISFLSKNGIEFTKVCEQLVEDGKKDPIFKDSINWLLKKSVEEWYENPKTAEKYISDPKVKNALLVEETFLKLNTGFFARICLNREQYDSYYKVLEKVLNSFFTKEKMKIVSQILLVCKERNYFMRYLSGKRSRNLSLNLLPETMKNLENSGYITAKQRLKNPQTLKLEMDPVVADYCEKLIDDNPKMEILLLSQTFMLQTGKFVMSPVEVQEKHISEMNLQRDNKEKVDMEKHFKIIY